MPTEQITINTALLEKEVKKCEEYISEIKKQISNNKNNLFHLCRFGDIDNMVMNEIKLIHLKALINGTAKLAATIFVLQNKIKTMNAWSHYELIELNALRETLILLEEVKSM